MATGQPSAASVLAIAAPIPREPPVTRATPSCVRGYFAVNGRLSSRHPTKSVPMPPQSARSRARPLHDAGPPLEARAEGGDDDAGPGDQLAVALRRPEGERDGRGGGVAEELDAVDHAVGVQIEALADAAQDA